MEEKIKIYSQYYLQNISFSLIKDKHKKVIFLNF